MPSVKRHAQTAISSVASKVDLDSGPDSPARDGMVASAAIPPVTVVIAVACSAMVVVLVVILWIMVMLLSLDEAHGSRSTMRATM